MRKPAWRESTLRSMNSGASSSELEAELPTTQSSQSATSEAGGTDAVPKGTSRDQILADYEKRKVLQNYLSNPKLQFNMHHNYYY